jgi:hypothetical protein
MKNITSKISIVLFIIFITSSVIDAIPAFGRKYQMSCQTCHAPFPKLKAYGEEFAGNGFVLADKDAPRYYMPTGDDQLSLIRDIPLALRLEGYVTYNNRQSKQFDFTAPNILKILSGGALTDNVAYYFYFFFSERGEVAGIEDAFIMFNNLFDTEVDLIVGQFQVSDPLFKRELRLTLEDYNIYKVKTGYAKADLSYDRGIMLTYGLPSGTDFTFQITNGNGIGHASNLRVFDNDKNKIFVGRISQEINEWFRIGGFGLYGKENLENSLNMKFTNTVSVWGPDFSIIPSDKLELNFQYLQRTDKKPDLFLNDLKTSGGFGELIYMPKGDESKWYAVALYNWTDSDDKSLKYSTGTLSLGYMLRRNIRLIGEYTYDTERKFGQFSVGVISAF